MIIKRKFRTKEAQKKERRRIIIKTIFIITAIIATASFFVYIVNLDSLQLKNVKTETDGILSEETITETVNDELNKKYFWFFPKKSVFRFKYKSLEKTLQKKFPRIKTISIKHSSLSDILIKITERTPKALWCGDIVPPIASKNTEKESNKKEELWGTCYLIDENGFIYAKSPTYGGDILPRYYGSLEHSEPTGQQYIPKEDFKIWQNFYAELSKTKLNPQALLFVDETDVEVYLSNGIKVVLPRNEDTNTIKKRLIATLDFDKTIDVSDIDYIDLRFGNKAFIKYLDKKEE
jgi:cell division septal protein FtsQ